MTDRNIPTKSTLTNILHAKASRNKTPLNGTFELSPVCNFNCRMCYVRKTHKEVEQHSREILKIDDWIQIAKEAREAGMLYLLLTGGEPLLWPDFWQLYDVLSEMGFLISINTNGSLIDEKAIEHFKQRPPYKINITLYGASDDTYQRLCGISGVFTKVDKAIRRLQAEGILVKLNCSLTPENADDLEWIINYGKEREAVLQVSTYMYPPVRRDHSMIGENERFIPKEAAEYRMQCILQQQGEKVYHKYLQRILDRCAEPLGLNEGCIDPIDGKSRCRAGKASFWVTWDGWMTPCGMMPEPKVDLKEKRFDEAWNALTEITEQISLSGVCEKCPNKENCHPCAAISFAETGWFGGIPTYMCEVMHHIQQIARKTLNKDKI